MVEGHQDLLLLCCGGDGCVMTSGALLKALSPQVLNDMVCWYGLAFRALPRSVRK